MKDNKRKLILILKCKGNEPPYKTRTRLLLAANIPFPPLSDTDFGRN